MTCKQLLILFSYKDYFLCFLIAKGLVEQSTIKLVLTN